MSYVSTDPGEKKKNKLETQIDGTQFEWIGFARKLSRQACRERLSPVAPSNAQHGANKARRCFTLIHSRKKAHRVAGTVTKYPVSRQLTVSVSPEPCDCSRKALRVLLANIGLHEANVLKPDCGRIVTKSINM